MPICRSIKSDSHARDSTRTSKLGKRGIKKGVATPSIRKRGGGISKSRRQVKKGGGNPPTKTIMNCSGVGGSERILGG